MPEPMMAVQDLGQCLGCGEVVACRGLISALLYGKLGDCHKCGRPMRPRTFGFKKGKYGFERISVLKPELVLKRRTRHSVMRCPPQSKCALKQEAYWNGIINQNLRDSEKLYGKRGGGRVHQ